MKRKVLCLLIALAIITTFMPIESWAADEFIIQDGVLVKYKGPPYDGTSKAVTIPHGVTEIGDSAFNSQWGVASVIIPQGVTIIGSNAFAGCGNLVSVSLPDSLITVKLGAFSSCSRLVGIDIPDGVTEIGNGAFSRCESLINVYIPASVASLGERVFSYCIGLETVVIAGHETRIGDDALSLTLTDKVIICCEAGSYAEQYARENSIPCMTGVSALGADNPRTVMIPVIEKPGYTIVDRYIKQAHLPLLQTVISPDGGISVMDTLHAIIYEFSASMEPIKTQTFKKELDSIGGFTKDSDGNYYIFCAKEVEEGAKTEKNMVLVKYSESGQKLNEAWFEAYLNDSRNGVKIPFDAGTCRIEISGDMIAVYFAREMFMSGDGLNHQTSYGFILELDSFKRLTGDSLMMAYAAHSFNQFILPIDGGFMFVDHADGNPRAFAFETVKNIQSDRYISAPWEWNDSIDSFRFAGNAGDNTTHAELGGIAKTDYGYLFAGTYRKNDTSGPQDLLLLTINDSLTSISDPIWITNYADLGAEKPNTYAYTPKIVRIGDNQYLLLWGKREGNYKTVCMAIVDGLGEILEPIQTLFGVTLNGNDVLRYNPVTGLVHWAVSELGGVVALYGFDPSSAPRYNPPGMPAPEAPSSWAESQVNEAIAAKLVPQNLQSKYTRAITRAEFCALSVTLYETVKGTEITERNTFTDTNDANVEKMAALKVVNGVGDNRFDPDAQLTREQAATMLARLAEAIGKPLPAQAPTFKDNASVSTWAFDAVGQMQTTGIMGGMGDNTFSPATEYTREQSIATILRMYNILK